MIPGTGHTTGRVGSNGVAGVGVLYDYGSREELTGAGSRSTAESVSEPQEALTL